MMMDMMAKAAREAEIDRMARAARRHIRYERVKACKAIARFRFTPITAGWSQKMTNAFWRQGLDEIGFGANVTRRYDAPIGEARQTVVVRLPRA